MKIFRAIIIICFLLVVILPSQPVYAGDKIIDSLHKVLQKENLPDTTKVNTLVELFYRYREHKKKNCLEYGSKAFSVSSQFS